MEKTIIALKNFEGAVYKIFHREDPHKVDISLFEMSKYDNEKEAGKIGINWPGCGTQSIEETESFIKLLQRAIIEAKKRNSN